MITHKVVDAAKFEQVIEVRFKDNPRLTDENLFSGSIIIHVANGSPDIYKRSEFPLNQFVSKYGFEIEEEEDE